MQSSIVEVALPPRKPRTPIKRVKRLSRTTTKPKARVKGKQKAKEVKTKKADILFSKFIRERDGKCLRCGSLKNLTCSHFWSRVRSSTRFDPENCDTLCWLPCHYQWEHEKHAGYRDFKIKQLGEERYFALEKRANTLQKRKESIEEFLQRLQEGTL